MESGVIVRNGQKKNPAMKKDRHSLGILLALVVTISYLHAQKIRQNENFQPGMSTITPVSFQYTPVKPDFERNKIEFSVPAVFRVIF